MHSKTAIEVERSDTLVVNERHYFVTEVYEFAPSDFESDDCIAVEFVTTPRLPIGEETFSPYSIVTVTS